MDVFRHSSLRGKLMAVSLLASVPALLVVGLTFFLYQQHLVNGVLEQDTVALARMLAANCDAAILFQHREDAEQSLDALRTRPSVVGAELYEKVGDDYVLFASYDSGKGNVPAPKDLSMGRPGVLKTANTLTVVEPVCQKTHQVGALVLAVDLFEKRGLVTRSAGALALMMSLAFVVVLVLSSQLQRLVSAPILGLAEAAKQVSEAGDFAVRVESSGADEIAILAEAFNTMLGELHRREDALRSSEEQFRTLVASLPGAVYRCDCDEHWTMRFLSDAAERITGYPSSDFINNRVRSFASVILPEDTQLVDDSVRQGLNARRPYIIDYRVRHASGEIRWVHEQGQGCFDSDGNLLFLAGAILDETVSRRAQGELTRLTSVLESTSDMVSTATCSGQLTYMNAAGRRMLGWSEEESLVGKKIGDAHPAWAYEIIEKEGLPTAIEKGVWMGETALLGPGGTEIPTSQVIIAHKSPDGKLEYASTIIRDMSAYKEAEREAVEARQFTDTVLNSVQGVFYVLNAKGAFVRWNRQFREVTGYSDEELSEMSGPDVFRGDDVQLITERIKEAVQTGHAEAEADLVTRSGRSIPYYFTGWRAVVGDELYVAGMGVDVTEQRRIEAQLRQVQKMEALGTLAGGIAHDFNNMLSAIFGYLNLANKRCPPENERLKHHLAQIEKAAARARDLVAQILTFSRRDRQTRTKLYLGVLVKEVLNFLRASVPSTIEIKSNIADTRLATIGAPTQIHQVLMNLCTNAVYAMQDEPGELFVSLEPATLSQEDLLQNPLPEGASPGAYLKLTIRDTGCGMDEETLPRVFDPFFTTKPEGEGTGMGLAVVHGIVTAHGGTIQVSSKLGEGTAIEVLLPAATGADSETAETDENVPAESDVPLGPERGTLLLVDDEELVAKASAAWLRDLGYHVITETDSETALARFKANPLAVDLVITDQMMPRLTGEELARQMLELRPDVPIVLCTGYSDRITPERARELGIQSFLIKPVNQQRLRCEIARLIAGK